MKIKQKYSLELSVRMIKYRHNLFLNCCVYGFHDSSNQKDPWRSPGLGTSRRFSIWTRWKWPVLVDSVSTVSLLLAHPILWQSQKLVMLIWRTQQGLKASNPVPESRAPSTTSVWPAESNFSTCPKPSRMPPTQPHASQDFLCPHTTTNNAVSPEESDLHRVQHTLGLVITSTFSIIRLNEGGILLRILCCRNSWALWNIKPPPTTRMELYIFFLVSSDAEKTVKSLSCFFSVSTTTLCQATIIYW